MGHCLLIGHKNLGPPFRNSHILDRIREGPNSVRVTFSRRSPTKELQFHSVASSFGLEPCRKMACFLEAVQRRVTQTPFLEFTRRVRHRRAGFSGLLVLFVSRAATRGCLTALACLIFRFLSSPLDGDPAPISVKWPLGDTTVGRTPDCRPENINALTR